MAVLGLITYQLFVNDTLTTPYTGVSQFTHQSDLSDGSQDIVLYFGSNTAGRKLEATSNPGVDDILITPTVSRDEWAATTVYILGNSVEPVTPNGFRYVVSTAGTSDGSEPTWPTAAIGDTVVDGTVVWTLTAAAHPVTEIKLASTNGGLAAAVAGDPMNLGTEVLSEVANHIEIHMRLTNTVTTVSNTVNYPGIGVDINDVTEGNV